MSALLHEPADRPFVAFRPALGAREMAGLAFRQRRKMLAALLLPPALAVALLLVLPPSYRAQSDLLVKTGREYLAQADGESGLTAPTSTKQEGIQSEIALLTGRAVVDATIRSIGLETLYPKLVADPPWFRSLDDAAVYKFSKDLAVEPIKLSNVVAVSFNAASPALAKQVLDRLIAIYIDKHAQVFSAGRSDSYAEAIGRDAAEAQALERQRTRIKLDGGIYDIGAQRAALISQRVAAQAHGQDAADQQATLTAKLAALARALPGIPATAHSSSTDRNDEQVHARQTLLDLRASEAAMAARYAPGNPDLQRVRGQIAAISQNAAGADRVNTQTTPSPLRQQVEAEMVMDRAQLAPLAAERARYAELVASLDGELHRLEQADLELRTTEARIEALNDNLKLVQARYDQARTQEQMDQARQVSVVQVAPAIVPDRADKPKKPLFLAAGLLLGLLGAGGAAVLAVFAGNVVVTADGAERLLGLPVLAILPPAPRRAGPVTLPLE